MSTAPVPDSGNHADVTAPSIIDIEAAARRLDGHAVATPLLSAPLLNERLGLTLLIKAEPLQKTGSFKYRGAYNRISQIPEAQRAAGVVAFSSGNHAQGVAAAARDQGMAATIVMPADAPAVKIRNTKAWGARVVLYDRDKDDREAIGAGIAAETGATLVRPYDDPAIIAGQGTVGLEAIAQAQALLGHGPDAVMVPCGGGGLVSGVALAVADRAPGTQVFAVEPAGFDDTARSFAAGQRMGAPPAPRSICDALLGPMPGIVTFPILSRTVAGVRVVDDEAVRRAMAVAFDAFRLVVEPGGAVALAALLADPEPWRGRTVLVVCSGGNVEPSLFAEAVAAGEAAA